LHFNSCLTTEYSETTAHFNGNFDTDNQILSTAPYRSLSAQRLSERTVQGTLAVWAKRCVLGFKECGMYSYHCVLKGLNTFKVTGTTKESVDGVAV
jgi:hypothetical protein